MPIPPFNQHGWLPEGVHDCLLEDAAKRFGSFQKSDRRPQLWAKFSQFVIEAKAGGVVLYVIADGSFVTAEPAPNDIDLVLVVPASHNFAADLPPAQYALLAQRRVQKRFGFDIVVVKNGSENLEQAVAFFQQVRERPGKKKGLLRIAL